MAAALEQDAQNAPAAPDAASAAPEEPTAAAPRERVRVAVRVRPLTEGAKRATACAKNKLRLKTAHDEKTFKFDVVFDETATQDRVYAHTAQKLVERVFDGRNATIMAYGQTGMNAASEPFIRDMYTYAQVPGRPTPWASRSTCCRQAATASSRGRCRTCSRGAELCENPPTRRVDGEEDGAP